ncbi:MAG: hypothetical protein ACT4SY_03845 [Hyphomicrobiales bacterium]
MTDSGTPAETPPEPQAPQPGLKFLEAAVYIMGGVLVLMFVALIGGIAWKIATRGETPVPETKLIELGLPPETKVNQLALDGDRMAIGTGEEIIVVDVRKGTVISRIKLRSP